MTDEQIANVFTVFMVVFGMLMALIAGYYMEYNDAKRHKETK